MAAELHSFPCLHSLSFAGLIFSHGGAESQDFNLATNDLGTLSTPVNTLQGKIIWLSLGPPAWLRGFQVRGRRSQRTLLNPAAFF